VAELLEGASLAEARQLNAGRVVRTLQLAEEREHVAVMAIEAAQDALLDWERKLTTSNARRTP
jgi:prolyl-tRNA editing enzyme YbaK/EbsC (Cys-tRNA(Pro) deacylase)